MPDRRRGRGANWTPTQARELLAIPVMYVLLRMAGPTFSGSSRASVSRLVEIRPFVRTDQLLPGLACGFPTSVNWEQWESAVVPVLLDPKFDPCTPLIREMLNRNPREYANVLGEALGVQFHKAGYGPLPPERLVARRG